ncbi:MAG TPA: NADH:flavin oxidoreductase [Acidimicrobiales bacterium]|nr:NADH:flavin oxidoreductase [Acidimicrobiales bacterium]
MTGTGSTQGAGSVFSPGRLGPVELRNRIVKSATNEGMARGAVVSDALVEFHRRMAAGGAAMTTLAYVSVSSDGRTYRHQLWMRDEVLDGLVRLVDAVHGEGAAAAVQLGHSGYFANKAATGVQPVGPSKVFNPAGLAYSRPATVGDLDRLEADFAAAAVAAAGAGFDAVEVHLGHGYLLSQFLSPFTNRRTDEYGGSIENRARFPRRVLRAVRQALAAAPGGERVAITAKLNMDDGFDGGLTLDDGVAVARMLEEDGSVDALELTGGFTSKTPMYLMRGDVPLAEMIADERSAVRRLGLRIAGRRFMKAYPFEEAFFQPNATKVRQAVSLPLILLGGITRLDTMERAMAEGFEFVALGRALLRDPDLPRKLQAGDTPAACVPCNKCVIEMERHGTRCVFVPESEWMTSSAIGAK